MEENKKIDEKQSQNQENATKETPENSNESKARRDRPDRPKRAGNPHRRPKTNAPAAVEGNVVKEKVEVNGNVHAPENNVDGNKEAPKRNPNQNKPQHKKPQHNNQNKNANANPSANGSKPVHNKNNNKKPNRNGGGGRRPKKFVPGPMSEEMKASIAENNEVNDLRMNPWKQIDVGNQNKVRFTPLGGLGEIGGNMAVMEDEDSAFIIDVGMSFPDETMHGVDILVPDFSYLHAIKSKIKAVIITHAHEDHIGAVPYLFKELKFPIWGTPLALAMIENKFQEHGLMEDVKLFNYVTKRKQYDVVGFKI